jgi:hypothetical protein
MPFAIDCQAADEAQFTTLAGRSNIVIDEIKSSSTARRLVRPRLPAQRSARRT